MKRRAGSFASVLVVLFVLALATSAQDTLTKVAKKHESCTTTVALEFSKKNRNTMMRVLAAAGTFDPNAHATGFLVGDGLVMTSYHVVSGKLSARKKKLLGFKPDDELEVKIYVNGCQAKVVKIDQDSDLASVASMHIAPNSTAYIPSDSQQGRAIASDCSTGRTENDPTREI